MKAKSILSIAIALVLAGAGSVWARYDVNRPKPGTNGSGKTSRTAEACLPATSSSELDINNVRALLHNGGDMWWDLVSNPRYEIPKVDDPANAKHSMFASSLWIGGFDASGQLRIAAQTYRQSGNDFFPGPIRVDGTASTDRDICEKWDTHFKIEKTEIDAFRADVADGSVNLNDYPNVRDWPGTNPFNDPDYETGEMAPFIDVNENGEYDPAGGDYPDIDGDQAIWWVINDKGDIHTETNGEQIGVEIQMLAFAFATSNAVNDMTFYREKVINRSTNVLEDTYIGQWVDADLGFFADDFVGCDSLKGLGYCYNGDSDDDQPNGYGASPPAIGVDFFQGPVADANDGIDNDKDGEIDEIDTTCAGASPERISMAKFIYYNNDFSIRGNPQAAQDFYGYLSGFWRNGSPIVDDRTGNGNGFPDQGEIFDNTNYMFPDFPNSCNGQTCSFAEAVTNPDGAWDEECAGNEPFDRRFVQSAGPFTLQPGAINEIVVGVVWARDQTTSSQFGSVCKLLQADLVAQVLFDNCFQLLEGPDAPDTEIEELDRELVLTWGYSNPASNNLYEDYREADPTLLNVQDNVFEFEGYIVYQLLDGSVSANDLDDNSLARPIAQCDIENDVTTIVNREVTQVAGLNEPIVNDQIMVEGANEGLFHSLRVTQDAFAEGSQTRLVNYRDYYYAVVAYAHNDTASDGRRFLLGNGNFQRLEAMPHKTEFENFGMNLNAEYGDGLPLTRISGVGNGGRFIDLEPEIEQEIVANNSATIRYEGGAGPIEVKVTNPKLVRNETYRVIVTRDSLLRTEAVVSAAGVVVDSQDVYADWIFGTWDGSTFDPVYTNVYTVYRNDSDTVPAPLNGTEKVIPQRGISVSVKDVVDPGIAPQEGNNGFIGATIEFDDPTRPWLTGLPDLNNLPIYNWIRAGSGCEGATCPGGSPCVEGTCDDEALFDRNYGWTNYRESNNYDPNGEFESILGGTWSPYVLANYAFAGADEFRHGPALRARPTDNTGANLGMDLEEVVSLPELPNVDIVISKDPADWSRCLVIESSPEKSLSSGANPLAPRWAKSQEISGNQLVDANNTPLDPAGDRLTQEYGYSWFPGYAIDVDRGVRLNLMFAESSWYKQDQGDDMIWNPTATFDRVVGGRQYLYVLNQEYDGCENLGQFRVKNAVPAPNNAGVGFRYTNVDPNDTIRMDSIFKHVAWVTQPLLTGEQYRYENYDGIPTGARIKLRVNKAFRRDPATSELPVYEFNTSNFASELNQDSTAEFSVMEQINIVPNPYYGRSGLGRGSYEVAQLDNRVKITNLPFRCDIRIFTLDGQLVRTFRKESTAPDQEWDLKNDFGVPVSSGLYILHIDAGEFGTKTLKFFCIMSELDLNAY